MIEINPQAFPSATSVAERAVVDFMARIIIEEMTDGTVVRREGTMTVGAMFIHGASTITVETNHLGYTVPVELVILSFIMTETTRVDLGATRGNQAA